MSRADLPHLTFDFDFKHFQDSLQNLFRLAAVQQEIQAGFVVLHALMLEMNFVPKETTYEKRYDFFPCCYNGTGSFKIKYFHASFPNIFCQVLAVPVGCTVILHGNIANLHVGAYQTANVELDNYICFERSEHCTQDPEKIYHSLAELSEKFKSDFIVPVLYDICKIAGERPFPPFSYLPCDLKLHILSFLPAKNLVTMSAVNKEFQSLANDGLLWKNLCKRNFCQPEITETNEEDFDWKKLYKDRLREKKVQCLVASDFLPNLFPFKNWEGMCKSDKKFPLNFPREAKRAVPCPKDGKRSKGGKRSKVGN